MAKLGRFIINTDYDSFKIIDEFNWTVNVPQTVLGNNDSRTFTNDFSCDEGVFFEIQSAKISLFPDVVLTGTSYMVANKWLSGTVASNVNFSIKIAKPNRTTYRMTIKVSGSNITVPATDVSVKLGLLIPTEQQ